MRILAISKIFLLALSSSATDQRHVDKGRLSDTGPDGLTRGIEGSYQGLPDRPARFPSENTDGYYKGFSGTPEHYVPQVSHGRGTGEHIGHPGVVKTDATEHHQRYPSRSHEEKSYDKHPAPSVYPGHYTASLPLVRPSSGTGIVSQSPERSHHKESSSQPIQSSGYTGRLPNIDTSGFRAYHKDVASPLESSGSRVRQEGIGDTGRPIGLQGRIPAPNGPLLDSNGPVRNSQQNDHRQGSAEYHAQFRPSNGFEGDKSLHRVLGTGSSDSGIKPSGSQGLGSDYDRPNPYSSSRGVVSSNKPQRPQNPKLDYPGYGISANIEDTRNLGIPSFSHTGSLGSSTPPKGHDISGNFKGSANHEGQNTAGVSGSGSEGVRSGGLQQNRPSGRLENRDNPRGSHTGTSNRAPGSDGIRGGFEIPVGHKKEVPSSYNSLKYGSTIPKYVRPEFFGPSFHPELSFRNLGSSSGSYETAPRYERLKSSEGVSKHKTTSGSNREIEGSGQPSKYLAKHSGSSSAGNSGKEFSVSTNPTRLQAETVRHPSSAASTQSRPAFSSTANSDSVAASKPNEFQGQILNYRNPIGSSVGGGNSNKFQGQYAEYRPPSESRPYEGTNTVTQRYNYLKHDRQPERSNEPNKQVGTFRNSAGSGEPKHQVRTYSNSAGSSEYNQQVVLYRNSAGSSEPNRQAETFRNSVGSGGFGGQLGTHINSAGSSGFNGEVGSFRNSAGTSGLGGQLGTHSDSARSSGFNGQVGSFRNSAGSSEYNRQVETSRNPAGSGGTSEGGSVNQFRDAYPSTGGTGAQSEISEDIAPLQSDHSLPARVKSQGGKAEGSFKTENSGSFSDYDGFGGDFSGSGEFASSHGQPIGHSSGEQEAVSSTTQTPHQHSSQAYRVQEDGPGSSELARDKETFISHDGQKEYHLHKIIKHIPVEVPHHIPIHIVKHVPLPIERPVPVQVIKHYPVHVPKPYKVIVEKKVPVEVERKVPYPVPQPIAVEIPKPYVIHVPKPVHVYVKKTYPVAIYKHNSSHDGGGEKETNQK